MKGGEGGQIRASNTVVSIEASAFLDFLLKLGQQTEVTILLEKTAVDVGRGRFVP